MVLKTFRLNIPSVLGKEHNTCYLLSCSEASDKPKCTVGLNVVVLNKVWSQTQRYSSLEEVDWAPSPGLWPG